ncbi:NADH-quinone oxidoreductase subunit NuoG [Thiomicrorhabdus sp. 6S3-12]|uniref:NADH-quinone oxidoreductase subunit NuoG n=1 Tax=Thiomicrorhabdus sp. 6S3-12 TaxID=2819681 RepID=UPI001AADD463|nr:NADH-quinone oxidoreductase subunit NuoG [Thiomicrorhabdus sp. 6S3-12]MBO1923483.1 NADH-quinone oxidoreductase subunit G [Thiomicrorhabdus sp. 6S3-12]
MVKVEINGQVIEAREGDMLIDVADNAEIPIPRFCYHKKLSIAANCRMCLVDVEGAWKPLPACATPVTDGMVVRTNSPKAIAAQKSVMEFLLINHPLDCPICDQGGECELQDVAMDYGEDVSRYAEAKRVVGDKNAGPLISTDMTRCIHCTRCVRFGQEVAGMMELGATGRSEWMEIGTYVEKSIDSEMSGNMIDLCPVGALTSKPFRYKTRTWELKAHKAVAGHDSIGSNIQVHTKDSKVMRVVPSENEAINEVWLSDRDRFAYEGMISDERLTQPMIKVNGKWQTTDWESALEFAVEGLKNAADASQEIGVLGSANSTLEELHLLQKLARGMGVENIDFRTRQVDFSADAHDFHTPSLEMPIADVEQLNAVAVVGSYLRKELPLLNLRVRKATLNGASVIAVNPQAYKFNYDLNDISDDAGMVANLAGMAKAAAEIKGDSDAFLADVSASDAQKAAAQTLIDGNKSAVMVGQIAQNHSDYALICKLAASLAKNTDSSLNILPMQANEVGAYLVNFLPLKGKNAAQMAQGMDAFLTLNVEPEDFSDSEQASQAMAKAKFVVSMSLFDSEAQRSYADVLLPIASYAETAGTFVNLNGLKQSFKMAAQPVGDAKAAWKVLRVMGNMLNLSGFDYTHSNEVLREVLDNCGSSVAFSKLDASMTTVNNDGKVKLVSPYQMDALVRRAPSLQKTPDANVETMVRG